MHFSVLGPLRIEEEGAAVALSAPRQRSLLGLLLVHANEVVSTDRILEDIWGDEPPASGVKALHYHVSKLRDALGSGARILTHPPGYLLEADRDELDVFEFEDLAFAGKKQLADDPEQAAGVLGRALELWRGAPYADFAYEAFAIPEINRLTVLHRTTVADRVEGDLACGRHRELIAELEGLVDAHPYDERFRAQLMTALYRAGRQADALQAYQNARALLGDELGIDPSVELQALEEQILLQAPELASPAASTSAFNLPSYLSRFIGRADELAAIEALLASNRLLTLVGPGGIGKTRMVIEAASGRMVAHRHGVTMVDLSSTLDPAAVPQAFADAFSLRVEASTSLEDSIVAYLGRRDMLVVVDNCEQVLEASAQLMHRVLVAAPSVTVLATSREPLGIPGEVTYRVPPLGVVPGDADQVPDALGLFVDRAERRRSDLDPDDRFKAIALRICERLDGIPLAIELAAARLRVMSIAELEQGLNDRFVILTGGDRTEPLRHQTLQATLDWSYELLDVEEQMLLRRLSVFRGGFDYRAFASCVGDLVSRPPLDVLTRLCDTSMVMPGRGEPARYRLLETIREYAAEKLDEAGEADDAHERHAQYYGEMAVRTDEEALSGDRVAAFERLRADEANVRTAIAWAVTHGAAALALDIAAATGEFWFHNDHIQARRLFASAVDVADDPDPTTLFTVLAHMSRFANWEGKTDEADALIARQRRLAQSTGDSRALARSLASQGAVAWTRGSFTRAREYLSDALKEIDVAATPEAAKWLAQVSWLATWMGDLTEAERCIAELERLASGQEDPTIEARIADCRGTILLQVGELERAAAELRHARQLFAKVGMTFNVLDMLQSEATILIDLERYDEAQATVDQLLAQAREVHDARSAARGVLLQGRLEAELGDPQAAERRLRSSLRMSDEAGNRAGVLLAVLALASTADRQDRPGEVLRLHGIAESIRIELAIELPAATQRRVGGEVVRARSQLEESRADDVWAQAVSGGYSAALELLDDSADSDSPSRSAMTGSTLATPRGGT